MKSFSAVILEKADQLLAASKSLDYDRIVRHEPGEVAKLQAVLQNLQITKNTISESLGQYAQKQQGPKAEIPVLDRVIPAEADSSAPVLDTTVQRELLIAQLDNEGFGERVDQVYNSFAGNRSLAFQQVPHERGIPDYLVVMAPDFTPVAGLHGIFISERKIMSIILPSDNSSAEWTMLKSKSYHNEEEMIEFLTLIAAGFDVP